MAITNEVDLCNIALGMLGQPGIASLVDDPETATSKAQKWCSRLYPFVRDNLLEAHPWFWASTRVALVLDEDYPPEWGYTHAYLLPTDYLRLCENKDDEYPFTIETHPTRGKRMLTEMDEVYVRYVWRVTNVNLMPNFFVMAVARQLAAELAYPLCGERDLGLKLVKMAKDERDVAAAMDFGCELSQPAETEDPWITARR